jgi:hypothetical protein
MNVKGLITNESSEGACPFVLIPQMYLKQLQKEAHAKIRIVKPLASMISCQKNLPYHNQI